MMIRKIDAAFTPNMQININFLDLSSMDKNTTDFTYMSVTRLGMGTESPGLLTTPPMNDTPQSPTVAVSKPQSRPSESVTHQQFIELPSSLHYVQKNRNLSNHGVDTVCGTEKSLTSLVPVVDSQLMTLMNKSVNNGEP